MYMLRARLRTAGSPVATAAVGGGNVFSAALRPVASCAPAEETVKDFIGSKTTVSHFESVVRPCARMFSPVDPKLGHFLAGNLKVEHHLPPINFVQQRVLGIIPPAGEAVRTVVRHTADEEESESDAGKLPKLTWLRVFDDGKAPFTSAWTLRAPLRDTLAAMRSEAAPAGTDLLGSEAIAGIHFAQRLELSEGDGGQPRLALVHESSSLFGIIPLPVFVMQPHCVMDVHPDGKGYHLTVEVKLCGCKMVSYRGNMCEVDNLNDLSEEEARGLGVA
eukprot:SAG22_NODE_3311_length_1787_cov_1.626777_2_plen_276_part_00